MKKIISSLLLISILISVFAIPMTAAVDRVIENPQINIFYNSPTIDGKIDVNEAWSAPAAMNAGTLGYFWGHNPLTSDANTYYAFDNEGIYVAANIVEGLSAIDMQGNDVTGLNQFNYSTGYDDLDFNPDNGYGYGWNGDVFGVTFDPLNEFVKQGFTSNAELSAWYFVGLFEGDVARVYREHVNKGEITEQVKVAGEKTVQGWRFEMMIPWDIIIKDARDTSYGMVDLTKEEIIQNNAIIKTSAMYHDRYYDEEADGILTWGSFITVATMLPDGTPGHMSSGNCVAACGITLCVNNSNYTPAPYFPDVPNDAWYAEGADYCAKKGYITGNEKGEFMPNGKLTREQFVTILARVDGAELGEYAESCFTDVKASDWYGPSVIWAAAEGYVKGVGDGTRFGVGMDMTREQLATMLYRHAGESDELLGWGEVFLEDFTDRTSISDWAINGCIWAVLNGIISSTNEEYGVLAPQMTVTRAQAAKIFMSYDEYLEWWLS